MKIKELIEKVNNGVIKSDITIQREIVYSQEKQSLVIDSIVKGIPLPAFYLWKDKNTYEVLDGRQRIHSITQFVQNNLEYQGKIWKDTAHTTQKIINESELSIIVSEGTEELKREIFNRINTLGVPLSQFEVLNGLYNGEYIRGLSSFVNNDKETKKILGTNSRGKNQLILLKIITKENDVEKIGKYLKENMNKSFGENDQFIIKPILLFVAKVFVDYKNVDILFRLAQKYLSNVSIWAQYKDQINEWLKKWTKSDDYKLTHDRYETYEEGILAITKNIMLDPKRNFSADQKEELFNKNKDKDNKCKCAMCEQHFYLDEMQVDHIKPWSKGGRTELSNAQLLCRACNIHKSNK